MYLEVEVKMWVVSDISREEINSSHECREREKQSTLNHTWIPLMAVPKSTLECELLHQYDMRTFNPIKTTTRRDSFACSFPMSERFQGE